MTIKELLTDLRKCVKGRALTPEEIELLLANGTWDELHMAYLLSNGNSTVDEARIRDRMKQLHAK